MKNFKIWGNKTKKSLKTRVFFLKNAFFAKKFVTKFALLHFDTHAPSRPSVDPLPGDPCPCMMISDGLPLVII